MKTRLTPEEYRELAEEIDRLMRGGRAPSPQWMAERISEVVAARPKRKAKKGARK